MSNNNFNCLVTFILTVTMVSCERNDAVTDIKSGLYDIYIYNVSTNTNTRITNSPGEMESFYSFSADSRQVLYNSEDGTYLMNIDGSGLTHLTAKLNEPHFSPDGFTIAYIKDNNLFLVNADGTNDRQLTSGNSGLWAPVWSHDGQKIACSSDNGLCIVSLDGNINNFIHQNSACWYDWSTDSRELTYCKFVSGGFSQIYKYDFEEESESELTSFSKYSYEPFWRPGKDEIVFTSSFSDYGSDLILMNSDGSGQKSIMHKNSISTPCWSPDGNEIAFITDHSDVAIVDYKGDDFRIINKIPGACMDPVWSPDGNYILYYRAILYD